MIIYTYTYYVKDEGFYQTKQVILVDVIVVVTILK